MFSVNVKEFVSAFQKCAQLLRLQSRLYSGHMDLLIQPTAILGGWRLWNFSLLLRKACQEVAEIESDRKGVSGFLNPVGVRDVALWGAPRSGRGVSLATPALFLPLYVVRFADWNAHSFSSPNSGAWFLSHPSIR